MQHHGARAWSWTLDVWPRGLKNPRLQAHSPLCFPFVTYGHYPGNIFYLKVKYIVSL